VKNESDTVNLVRRPRIVAVTSVALGLIIFVAATGWIRNLGGDILVVVAMVACLASVPVGTAWLRVTAVAVFSVGIESLQGLGWVDEHSHWFLHLTIGSTFDPQDLAAYEVGLGVALVGEWWWGHP
jgi:hypothetical protein